MITPRTALLRAIERFHPDTASKAPRHHERETVEALRALLESLPADDSGPLRNCWTCRHEKAGACVLMYREDISNGQAIQDWIDATHQALASMPPRTADGCPGWEPGE